MKMPTTPAPFLMTLEHHREQAVLLRRLDSDEARVLADQHELLAKAIEARRRAEQQWLLI